jgi:glycosyltransferase involved in cell wall biosynthesis
MSNPDHFILLFQNIDGFKGGIQVYSCFLLQALQELYPNAQFDVFLKYDTAEHQAQPKNLQAAETPWLPQTRFHLLGHWLNKPQAVVMMWQVLMLAARYNPTLLITTHVNFAPVGWALSRWKSIPYWVIAHGDEVWDLTPSLKLSALQQAHKILTVSRYTRDRLIKGQGVDANKIDLLPCTFDPNRFKPGPKPTYLLERYGIKPDQPVLLSIGKLVDYKGYRQVLRALPVVKEKIPDIHYVLGGKGPHAEIQKLITELSVQEHVTLLPFIEEKELCNHYNLCDIFIMPSTGEGFGIVFLEALACGKAVIAGNQDGSSEPLLDGKRGDLVEPRNPEVIAKVLIEVLSGQVSKQLRTQDLEPSEQLRQATIQDFGYPQFRDTLQAAMLCSQF